MAQSDNMHGHGEKAAAQYDAHLEQAEERLETAAHKAESSFYERTAVPEAQLEKAEEGLETAARKVEGHAAE